MKQSVLERIANEQREGKTTYSGLPAYEYLTANTHNNPTI